MKKNYGGIYTLPITIWVTVFFLVPVLIVFLYSFLERSETGGVVFSFSLAAYSAMLNPLFGHILLDTLWISLASTVLTMLIALPCGYYMARSRKKSVLLFLIVIPFLTNFLIRIYAWQAILGNNGFLNSFLLSLGLIDRHIQFLYNEYAVTIVLVYSYLPYAILPLYSTIEKFDFSLLEAARDLGASHLGSIRRVMIPNIRSGIVSAVLFTFIPTFGAYAVPKLVGGGKSSFMLGNVIADNILVSRNWPYASATSILITLVTTAAMGLYLLANRAPLRATGQAAKKEKA
ncbi:MAG: ABC transporter permease [Spirochaetales bacterium]|nr:ABC transporter permease [Spirochaetales bacterium]